MKGDEPTIAPSIRRHLVFQWMFQVAGSIGAVGAWIYYQFETAHRFPAGATAGIGFVAAFFLGYLIPRTVFTYLLGATCPTEDCRGKAFPKGRNPVIYVCPSCRGSYPTGVSEEFAD